MSLFGGVVKKITFHLRTIPQILEEVNGVQFVQVKKESLKKELENILKQFLEYPFPNYFYEI